MFSFLLCTIETFASEDTLPSGIKDFQIGKVIDDYIEENKDTTAAVSLAVFRGEETIYKTTYGYANIEDQLKADDETVYEWGSISKLLTWVSVMQLFEEGKIDLEVDIKAYLPEDFLTKLKYDEPITIINLMNHNAGFEEAIFQMCAETEGEILSLEEALMITEPHQVYKPGEVVSYSNWSTSLAGYIVERISGQPFYEYVQEHIFKPLEMNHTGMDPIYSDNPWVKAKLEEAEGYTYELEPMEAGLFYLNLYPAGSAAGTLDDIVKFAKALVPGSEGSKKLFNSEDTPSEMLSSSLKYPGTDIDYINHGLWSHEYSVQALGHGGNTDMYSTYLVFDPISGVGTVIMTNQGSEFTYNYGVPPIIFGQIGEMAAEEGGSSTSSTISNAKGDRISTKNDTRSTTSSTSEIQGLYYNARTVLNGIGKMYTVLNIQPYFATDDGNLDSSIPGMQKRNSEQIAPDTFVATMESGPFVMNTIERYSNINGTKRLSSPYGQSINADGEIWTLAISTILIVIAVVWSVLVLLGSFIGFIFKKARRKASPHDVFKKYEIILSLAILLLVVNIADIANKMMAVSSRSSLVVNIVVSIILALLPVGYGVQLIRKWPKLVSGKLQKVSYIITMGMGLVITLIVIVLEMYRF